MLKIRRQVLIETWFLQFVQKLGILRKIVRAEKKKTSPHLGLAIFAIFPKIANFAKNPKNRKCWRWEDKSYLGLTISVIFTESCDFS